MKSLFALALLTLALLLLGSLLTFATKDMRMTEDLIAWEQASALAESGLLHAEAKLQADPSWRGPLSDRGLGPGTYSVRITDLGGGSFALESTGTVGRSKVKKLDKYSQLNISQIK